MLENLVAVENRLREKGFEQGEVMPGRKTEYVCNEEDAKMHVDLAATKRRCLGVEC